MSRRRKSPPTTRGVKKVRVVCSNNGQHAKRQFGHVVMSLDADGSWRLTRTSTSLTKRLLRHSQAESPPAEQSPIEGGVQVTIRIGVYPRLALQCSGCGRTALVRFDRLEGLCAELCAADDTPELDVSPSP